MWFKKLILSFFFSIDSIIYNFISSIYNLLIEISKTSVLSQADINKFADRIYVLLGIFMLFKVAFSLIQYVVNPDDFSDKSKGVSKLGTNAIISLCMLVLVPYVFNYAYQLQGIILEENVLAQIFFAETDQKQKDYINTAGDTMAYVTMSAFFKPNLSFNELSACNVLLVDSDDGNGPVVNPDCFGIKKQSGTYVKDESVKNSLYSFYGASNSSLDEIDLYNYAAGIENANFSLMFRLDLATSTYENSDTGEEEFIIEYQYIISTVVGVIIVLLLVSFCLDVALRSVKLAFLQLIAPIPIISYMDPKSGKDGMFTKWYKMCFSTFLSLFVRLLALYLAVYIISMLGDGMVDITTGAYINNPLIQIIIIIGVLMFAKQLPKILEGFGIKLDGDGKFTLNPLKKIEDGALGGKYISRLPKTAGAAAMGLGMGMVGAATGAGPGRILTGLTGGLAGGLSGKKIGEIHKSQVAANEKMRNAIADGSTFWGRRGAQISNLLGSPGEAGSLKQEDKSLEEEIKKKEDFHSSFDNMKSKISSAIEANKLGSYSERYNNLKALAETAKIKRDSIKKDDYYTETVSVDADGNRYVERNFDSASYDAAVAAAANEVVQTENALGKYLKKDAIEAYYTAYRAGTLAEADKDAEVVRAFDKFDAEATANNVTATTLNSYNAVKENDNEVSNDITRLQNQRVEIRERKQVTAANQEAVKK